MAIKTGHTPKDAGLCEKGHGRGNELRGVFPQFMVISSKHLGIWR